MTIEFFAHRDVASMRPSTFFNRDKFRDNLIGKINPRLPGTSNLGEKPGLTFSKRVGRWLCLAVFLQIFWVLPASAHTNHPNVVILSSYHQGYEWSDKELAGLLDRLHQDYPLMDPAIEYLDAKRFPGQAQAERMKRYLAGKYRGRKVDLVILLDNPALNLALHYRQELFPGVPLVFAGINDFSPALLMGQQKVTGVAEVQDIAGTLNLALSLHPGAKEVLVIHDYTSTGLAARREVEILLPAFERRVKVSLTPPATFQEILEQVKSLPPGSIGLIMGFATDRRGVSLSQSESTRLLTAAGVPFYALTEPRLGHGIVGGVLLGGHEHGRRAGEIALKVLAGEDPARIPVDTNPTAKPMFDYLQLARFGIPLGALPGGSLVINRPVSFYSQNKQWIWGVSATVVFLSLVIFILSTNIMRRRWAEKALLASETSLRSVIDCTGEAILTVDRNRVITAFNPAFTRMLGYSAAEVLGQSVSLIHPSPESFQKFGEMAYPAIAATGSWRGEYHLKKKDGTLIPTEMSLTPQRLPDGTLIGYIGANRDISERLRAEQQILASLQEKEVLLKEIHHRVKNNLQIISTLLALQVKYRRNQDPAELFQDCQNRIRSMALIHESLYSTENLARINFRHYLEKLSARLLAAYGSMAQGIKIAMAGTDVHLDVSQAVPCGLIANELLVNSLKHAFPGRKEGEIQVSIEDTAGRRVLEVRDNGVGLGADFDLENPSTFGWMMVRNLAKQLGGDLTVQSNGGTSSRIVF